jgi:hypothetical protein
MPSSPEIKALLINDLWLPLAIRGGNLLFPRRDSKRMKLFTLTDSNCLEIDAFRQNKLIGSDVVAWQQSSLKAIRLETELLRGGKVRTDGKFEEVLNSEREAISDDIIRDILVLDFLSQEPDLVSLGRVEKEINGINILAGLLDRIKAKGFILIYTTQLNQINLMSGNLHFLFNPPLGNPDPVCNIDSKSDLIRNAMFTIMRTNNYHIDELKDLLIDIDETNKVFSIGFIALGSG